MAAPSVPRQSHHLYLVFKLFTPEEEILVLDLSFPILSHPDYFDFWVGFFFFLFVFFGLVLLFCSNVLHVLFQLWQFHINDFERLEFIK